MSRAMPCGRSVVTLHGPSLAWRSASARRWRTESSVQASLRTVAECMASASESETRVMGMPTAWAHDTTVTTRTARFTITDCSGYLVGQALPLPPAPPFFMKFRGPVCSVPGGTLVGGVELAADQCDQRDQVHPDEKRDTGADGAVHHVVAGKMADVPGESQGGEEPQNAGQDGAAPDVAPALFAVRAKIVERCGHGDGGEEGENVAGDPAGALPDPGEWRQEGIDFHPAEDGALHLAAEDDQQGGADQRDSGEQDQRHGDAALAEEVAVARHPVGGLKSLDQALDHAGRGPKGDDAGDDQEAGGPLTHHAELPDDQVFGARGNDLRKEFLQSGGNEFGTGLQQDGGGAGEQGEETEQSRVGGRLGEAEAAVVQRGDEALAEQPRKGPESHPHYGQV